MNTSTLKIDGDLTVYAVHDLKTQFMSSLSSNQHLQLDLSEVSEVDGAGLQLIASARLHAKSHGQQITIVRPSPVVHEALMLTGLIHDIDIDQNNPKGH